MEKNQCHETDSGCFQHDRNDIFNAGMFCNNAHSHKEAYGDGGYRKYILFAGKMVDYDGVG